MAFKYSSKDASSAWPAGDYDVVITAIEEQKSKSSGKDMLKLTLKAFNTEGREMTMFEYIVNPSGVFKLKQIAQALGKLAEFNATNPDGTSKFDPYSAIDKRLGAELGVKDDPEYGEKNVVKKFIGARGGSSQATPRPRATANASTGESVFKDSDIPFAPNKF